LPSRPVRAPRHRGDPRLPAEDRLADLHAHTCFSDGLFTPEQLVERARWLNLAAVAVTDHDTVAGLERALVAGRRHGIEVVPGVEMSCGADGVDVHILGYYLDFADRDLLAFFDKLFAAREQRARTMVEKLRAHGVAVDWPDVARAAGGAAVGRPHVAQALVEVRAVPSLEEAFRRWIGYDSPAYVPKYRLSPEEAVGFIKEHRGVAVVAHPGIYRRESAHLLTIAAGVDGIEAWHPDHTPDDTDRMIELARKNRLLLTGGSDCHGGRKKGKVYLGEVTVPYKYLAALKRLGRRRRN